ncbi:MAG: LysR family transcriptional regulator [Solirubrobacterales bacterium]|nr:LysR family transcriptional regulator [Solirubrobacterales bacterium]
MTGDAIFDLRRLKTLLEIARTGSFARAAETLHFTPSAVSQQMRALEGTTGVLLFERSPRGVELTEAGLALRDHAEAIIARLAKAEVELEAIGGAAEGRLRFGSFSSATGAFAARAFRIFEERNPKAAVSFVDGEPFETLEAIGENDLDLAVIFELDEWPARADYRGVDARSQFPVDTVPLFDDPYLLVLRKDHPLAANESITLEEASGERILVAPPWHRDLERAFSVAGLEPTLDFSCRGTGFEALQSLVSAGGGLTLMPRLALGWLREDLTARVLEEAPVRHVKTAAPVMDRRSSAAQVMIEILVSLTEALGMKGETPAMVSSEGIFEPSTL